MEQRSKKTGKSKPLSEGGKSKQSNTGLIIVGVVLVILLFGVGAASYYQYDKNQHNEQLLMNLTNQLKELRTDELSVEEKLSNIESDVNQNTLRLNVNDTRIEELQEKDLLIDGEIANREIEFENLSNQLRTLNEDAQAQEQRLNDQEQRLNDQEEMIDDQEETIDEQQMRIDDLYQDLRDLSDRIVNIDPNTILPGYTLLELDNIYKLYVKDMFDFMFPIDPNDRYRYAPRYEIPMSDVPYVIAGNNVRSLSGTDFQDASENSRELVERINNEFLEYSMSNWDDDNVVKIFLEDITNNGMTEAFSIWLSLPLLWHYDASHSRPFDRWYNFYLNNVSHPGLFAALHFNPTELDTREYYRARDNPGLKMTYNEYLNTVLSKSW